MVSILGEANLNRPLFIAIGVHRAQGLATLPGVIESVNALSAWAARDYDVIRIDDRAAGVTIDRIRSTLTPLDIAGVPDPTLLLDRPRIVVYFAGHGFAAWPDQYWVLSAGPNQSRERISANLFRDTLASYAPEQIAFISDACRTTAPLIGSADAVVDLLPGQIHNPQKDIFYSCQLGQASYAVPGNGGQPPHLVFSSILLDGLSRPDGANIDHLMLQVNRRTVTSFSLAAYLKQNVPIAALQVNQVQTTQCDPGFWPVDHIYAEFPAEPGEVPPENDNDLLGGIKIGRQGREDSPAEPRPRPAAEESNLEQIASLIKAQYKRDKKELLQKEQEDRINLSRSEWRAPLVRQVGDRLLTASVYDPTLAVLGAPNPFVAGPDGLRDPDQFASADFKTFRTPSLKMHDSKTMCLVYGEHSISMVPMIDNMHSVTIVDTSGRGMEFLSWISVYGDFDNAKLLHSAEAIKGLSLGYLQASDAPKIAEQIRYAKHLDPMMGIVAAYLYKIAGDTDNIRRMAFYYADSGQPIPFDIAMLGDLTLYQSKGTFETIVPPVVEAIEADDDAASFTKRATPQRSGTIAGVAPTLRAGWPYLHKSQQTLHKVCWEFIDNLAPAPITTFVGEPAVGAILKAFEREFQ